MIYPGKLKYQQPQEMKLKFGITPTSTKRIITRWLQLKIPIDTGPQFLKSISVRPRMIAPFYVISINGKTYPMRANYTYLNTKIKITSKDGIRLAVSFVPPPPSTKPYPIYNFGGNVNLAGTFGSIIIRLKTSVIHGNSTEIPLNQPKMISISTFDDLTQQSLTKEGVARGIGVQCEGHEVIKLKLKSGGLLSKACHRLLKVTSLYVNNLFEKHNITIWAMKGTLLGIIRDKGIIPWDYDADYAIMYNDINKIFALREQMWYDGYIMFSPPWIRYQNYQFVITMRTFRVTQTLLKLLSTSVSQTLHSYQRDNARHDLATEAWRLTDKIAAMGGWIELMAFTHAQNGEALSQVLCTKQYDDIPTANFTLKLSPRLDADWIDGHDYFRVNSKKYKHKIKPGWKTFANTQWDFEFKQYITTFDDYNVHKYCTRTAPVSFRYDFQTSDVFPLRKVSFYEGKLYVPYNYSNVLDYYIGPDWKKPKRRYKGPK